MNPLDFNLGHVANEDIDQWLGGNTTLAAEVRAKIGMVNYCIAGLKGMDSFELAELNFYIMGDAFLKNLYTVKRQQRQPCRVVCTKHWQQVVMKWSTISPSCHECLFRYTETKTWITR